MDMTLQQISDERSLQNLTYKYAKAVDRRDADLLCSIFVDDGQVKGPGFDFNGREGLAEITKGLDAFYVATMHSVYNNLFEIDGDHATGESYCVATHVTEREDGSRDKWDWGIRYQNVFARVDGEWKFVSRVLEVDWTDASDVLPVSSGIPAKATS